MLFARRTALLRLTAMAALVASAVLTADALRPGRAFCPLEQACDAARASPLGSVFGVPTSVLGMVAFGSLFLLTLLPVEWSRPVLRPAGGMAMVAGLAFVAYQALVLHSYCPLCLVADAAGFLAGILTISWPRPPVRLSGRRLDGEGLPRRLAWTVAATAAVLAPFVMPREEAPAWVELPMVAEADLGLAQAPADLGADPAPATDAPAAPAPAPRPGHPVPSSRVRPPGLPPAPWQGAALQQASTEATTESPTAVPTKEASAPRTEGPGAEAPAEAAPRPVVVVEYLNAYCQHCRKTHERLEAVIARFPRPVRVHRVYTWAGKGYPLWARACAYADGQGLGDAMFAALLQTPRESWQTLHAAAKQIGLDTAGLDDALRDRTVPPRLERDARLMRSAGLQGLPTLDIGRRRLMGEQTEADLDAALRAAAELLDATDPTEQGA